MTTEGREEGNDLMNDATVESLLALVVWQQAQIATLAALITRKNPAVPVSGEHAVALFGKRYRAHFAKHSEEVQKRYREYMALSALDAQGLADLWLDDSEEPPQSP